MQQGRRLVLSGRLAFVLHVQTCAALFGFLRNRQTNAAQADQRGSSYQAEQDVRELHNDVFQGELRALNKDRLVRANPSLDAREASASVRNDYGYPALKATYKEHAQEREQSGSLVIPHHLVPNTEQIDRGSASHPLKLGTVQDPAKFKEYAKKRYDLPCTKAPTNAGDLRRDLIKAHDKAVRHRDTVTDAHRKLVESNVDHDFPDLDKADNEFVQHKFMALKNAEYIRHIDKTQEDSSYLHLLHNARQTQEDSGHQRSAARRISPFDRDRMREIRRRRFRSSPYRT